MPRSSTGLPLSSTMRWPSARRKVCADAGNVVMQASKASASFFIPGGPLCSILRGA